MAKAKEYMQEPEAAAQASRTMTREECAIRMQEAKVRLTEAKAMSEATKAKIAQIEFDKQCEQLVYVETALDEFNRALAPIMGVLRALPQTLAMDAKLSPWQHEQVIHILDGAFKELGEIDFHFETAKAVDARAMASHVGKKQASKKK